MTAAQILYGVGTLPEWTRDLPPYVVVTDPRPWALAESRMAVRPRHISFAADLEESNLDKLVSSVPGAELVVGLGGGTAIDASKYMAYRLGLPLVLVPTATATNAMFTTGLSIRRGGVAAGLGTGLEPQRILVDFDLIRQAPADLNRAGAGDLVSLHTTLDDWKRRIKAGKAEHNPEGYARAVAALDSVIQAADSIRELEPKGLDILMRALAEWAAIAELKPPVPGAGSEHLFAWNMDVVTGKHLLHGGAVALGVLVMSILQENEPDRMFDVIRRLGVAVRPEKDLPITWDQLTKGVLTTPAFNQRRGRPFYTVMDEVNVDQKRANEIVARIKAEFDSW